MIPVKQSTYGLGTGVAPSERGDCFSACLASILEIPLAEVPRFCESDTDWSRAIDKWLAPRGLCYLEVNFNGASLPAIGWHIVTGHSPRNPAFRHCVVAYETELTFDPYKDGTEWLIPHSDELPWQHGFFIALDPSKTPPAE